MRASFGHAPLSVAVHGAELSVVIRESWYYHGSVSSKLMESTPAL
jgi:hypothetical protein